MKIIISEAGLSTLTLAFPLAGAKRFKRVTPSASVASGGMIPAHSAGPVLCLLLAMVFLPALRADAISPPAPVKPGPVMKVGDSWKFDDGLTITFLEVVSDTRRYVTAETPKGRPDRRVRGNAGVLLRIEAGNQEPKTIRLNTIANPDYFVIAENEFPEGVAGIPKSYSISIHKLLPEASKRGSLRAQGAYRMRLSVLVAL